MASAASGDSQNPPQEEHGAPERLRVLLEEKRAPYISELLQQRAQGWRQEGQDISYANIRAMADNADSASVQLFVQKMSRTLRDIDDKHIIVPIHDPSFTFLDVGCASGGFTQYVLLANRRAHGVGITLPTEEGGYEWGVSNSYDNRFELVWHNLLAYNLGPSEAQLRVEHPAFPYFDRAFNLVILGGSHVRNPVQTDFTRELSDYSRLELGQLQVGLRCVQQGGTIVMKLAKLESEETARVLYILDQVAREVHTHKPQHIHATRGSFYVIAKGITRGRLLDDYVSALQALWYDLTYGGEEAKGACIPLISTLSDAVPWEALTTDENLDRLIQLGGAVWEVQLRALKQQNKKYKHTERPAGAPDIRGDRRRGWKSRSNA